jgi:hypothetical protein
MPLQSPPPELQPVPAADGTKLTLLPYMPKFAGPVARTAVSSTASYGVGCGLDNLLPIEIVYLLVALVLGLGLVWVVMGAMRESRRKRTQLELHVLPRDLELRWSVDGKLEQSERVDLRKLGRVDIVEAGYQRQHLVANVLDREPLVIPMERHTDEAVHWLAKELAAAAAASRGASKG